MYKMATRHSWTLISQELDDPITLTGAIAALLQNGIILGQVIAYRKTTAQAAKISAAKKQ